MHNFIYLVLIFTVFLIMLYLCAHSKCWLAAKTGWRIAAACYVNQLAYEKLRWALASAINSSVVDIWFNRLDEPFLLPFLKINPRLALKPVRVYLSTRWNITQKTKVIIDTYQFIHSRSGFLQNSLLMPNGGILARTSLGRNDDATILLNYDTRFRKEGELVLSLWLGSLTRAVAFLSFSLESNADGSCTCYIGCLQGGKEGNQKEDVISASKAMYGLRPKASLVFTVQEIARAFGARKLLGVGSDIQAHRRKHLLHVPFLHDYTFDYDATWIDAGGVPDTEGWFSLPLETQRHTHEEIKTNKRAIYLRRYAMMDDLAQQIYSMLCVQDELVSGKGKDQASEAPPQRIPSTFHMKGGDTDDHTTGSTADKHLSDAADCTGAKNNRDRSGKNRHRCQDPGRFGDPFETGYAAE